MRGKAVTTQQFSDNSRFLKSVAAVATLALAWSGQVFAQDEEDDEDEVLPPPVRDVVDVE